MDIFKLNKISVIIAVLLVLAPAVLSFPVLPCQFYGEVKVNSSYAKPGTNVSVYDINGKLCGSVITDEYGLYSVGCSGDDLSTKRDEGARQGEDISIYVNGIFSEKARWNEGGFMHKDIDALGIVAEQKAGGSELKSPADTDYYLLLVLLFSVMAFLIGVQLRR